MDVQKKDSTVAVAFFVYKMMNETPESNSSFSTIYLNEYAFQWCLQQSNKF